MLTSDEFHAAEEVEPIIKAMLLEVVKTPVLHSEYVRIFGPEIHIGLDDLAP